MQSNWGDLGTDDNCYFKYIYKNKHFLYLYPGFAEEQAIGDGHLTLIEVNRFSLFFIKYETFWRNNFRQVQSTESIICGLEYGKASSI